MNASARDAPETDRHISSAYLSTTKIYSQNCCKVDSSRIVGNDIYNWSE